MEEVASTDASVTGSITITHEAKHVSEAITLVLGLRSTKLKSAAHVPFLGNLMKNMSFTETSTQCPHEANAGNPWCRALVQKV